jgi:hypothetical protein
VTPTEQLIDELVDEAFGPLAHLLPADVLALFRAELADALSAHPHGSLLVRRALPDPSSDVSGEVEREAGSRASSPADGKAGTGSG